MGNILIVNDNSAMGMTPYHSYTLVKKFETILGDISRGLIPTNTGEIFPVVFEEDFKSDKSLGDDSLFGNIGLSPY